MNAAACSRVEKTPSSQYAGSCSAENLSRVWDEIQENIASDPTGASSRQRQRLAFLNYLAHEEMPLDDKEICDTELAQIVVQEKQVRIVAGRQAFTHRAEGAVGYPASEFVLLTLKLVFFIAGRAEEISNWLIRWKCIYFCVPAVRAEYLASNPGFSPKPGAL